MAETKSAGTPEKGESTCMAVAGKAPWRKCGFHQGLEIRVGFKAGVLRKLGVGTIPTRGCGPSERMTVTIPNMPLPNDTPTVLSQKSTTRVHLPPCFQWGKGWRKQGISSNALPPHLLRWPDCPIYLSNIYWAFITSRRFARDLETQSWKHMVFVLEEHSSCVQTKVISSVKYPFTSVSFTSLIPSSSLFL